MEPELKKPNILSRLFRRITTRRASNRSSLTSVNQHRDPESTVAARESSSYQILPLPASGSTQDYRFQLPIQDARRADGIIDPSQRIALSPVPPEYTTLPQPLLSQAFPSQHHSGRLAGPASSSGTVGFLSGASGFRMGDIQYIDVSHGTVHTGGSKGGKSIDGWQLLLQNTAVNALHDSDARYDPPKCDEDTRVEVVGEIMDWINDSDGPRRILCMTGAAGSGKSALQQTTAEICHRTGILASSFFFSALDPSRNTVRKVVPTIAYQLGRTNPILKQWIKAAVESDPLIFSKSLRAQTTALIAEPLQHCQTVGVDIRSLPHALLVDGLDECASEDRQAEFLIAIKECLLADGLPFRVFIASRPEWAIRTALEPGGHLQSVAYHIRLSDQYDATEDMRRYLRRRFEDISLRIDNSQWFTKPDIDTLVEAASGQFIYVATVFKYISERRASPAERLKIVLTWTPHEGQKARPFEELDRLYTNILLAAKDTYEAVDSHHGRDFLLLFNSHIIGSLGVAPHLSQYNRYYPVDEFSVILGLEARAEENLISDLHSLVFIERHHNDVLRLRLYHKSFLDFLREASRSKDLFMPGPWICAHLAKCLMQRIIECPLDLDSLPDEWGELPILEQRTRRALRRTVQDLPFFLSQASAIDDEVVDFAQKDGWSKFGKLLPVVYSTGWLRRNWAQRWINFLRTFADNLRPELAAGISEFIDRWECEFEEWDREWAGRCGESGCDAGTSLEH